MAADEGADDVYRLPEDVKKSMQAQYERDVVAVHGADAAGCMEEEYNTFLHVSGSAAHTIAHHLLWYLIAVCGAGACVMYKLSC